MKLENKIKEKFIFKNNRNLIKWIYYFYHRYVKKYSKKSFSFGGVDLLIDRFFRNKKTGIYIDVGCYHPIKGSNTYLLHRKGWNGINIDLDTHAINLFERFRPKDHNIKAAVSEKDGSAELFSHHTHSAVQTIDPLNAKKNYKNRVNSQTISTTTLNSIIENSEFKDKKIDFITIDIEGHEYETLRTFDFKKYQPSIIVIEYNDPTLERVEFYYQNINNILSSNIYNLMLKNNYHFVNWHHADLIFVSENVYKNTDLLFP